MTGNKVLQDRIGQLIDALAQGLYERKDVMRLCLLAALAGESVFMLGPPGIAKSLIARRLICAFRDSRAFEYLMTRFSTPDEVFGPLSIQALKDEGKYLRLTDGYLPSAEVVFLDEIWKAGPAILNTLLTVINEHRFRNGALEVPVPMRLLITASNELPQSDSGLEALYDRMLLRLWLDRIQDKQNFRAMLTHRQDPHQDTVPPALKVDDREFAQWQQELIQVGLPEAIFEQLFQFRQRLEQLGSQDERADSLYVSDRRWKKALRLLQASAFFNGRPQIGALDLLLLKDCLWHDLYARTQLETLLRDYAERQAFGQERLQFALKRLQGDLERLQADLARELGCRLHACRRGLLRRRGGWRLDFKACGLERSQPRLRLLFLSPCQLDPKCPEEPTPTAEIETRALLRWLDRGGPVAARLPQAQAPISLALEVDADEQLVVRDAAHQAIAVAIARPGGIPGWQQQRWHARLDEMSLAGEGLQKTLLAQRRAFASESPHLFLGQEWLLAIEESLLRLAQQQQALAAQIDQAREALTRLIDDAGGANA